MADLIADRATFEFDGTPRPWSGVPVVNGHKILTVEKFTVEMEAQDIPHVTLWLISPDALKFSLGEAVVSVADETREALISLGWTPPADKS